MLKDMVTSARICDLVKVSSSSLQSMLSHVDHEKHISPEWLYGLYHTRYIYTYFNKNICYYIGYLDNTFLFYFIVAYCTTMCIFCSLSEQ